MVCRVAERIFARHGITLFDAEELKTHGGSLRIYGRHTDDESKAVTARFSELKQRELALGLERMEIYASFSEQVKETDRDPSKRWKDRRLRSPRQGQHPAELLRHPHRLFRLHCRQKSLQARSVHPGYPHRDIPSGKDCCGTPGICFYTALEFERRDHKTTGLHSRLGRQVHCAHPRTGNNSLEIS